LPDVHALADPGQGVFLAEPVMEGTVVEFDQEGVDGFKKGGVFRPQAF